MKSNTYDHLYKMGSVIWAGSSGNRRECCHWLHGGYGLAGKYLDSTGRPLKPIRKIKFYRQRHRVFWSSSSFSWPSVRCRCLCWPETLMWCVYCWVSQRVLQPIYISFDENMKQSPGTGLIPVWEPVLRSAMLNWVRFLLSLSFSSYWVSRLLLSVYSAT